MGVLLLKALVSVVVLLGLIGFVCDMLDFWPDKPVYAGFLGGEKGK